MKIMLSGFMILKQLSRLIVVTLLVTLIFFTDSQINTFSVPIIYTVFEWVRENFIIVITLIITPFFLRSLYTVEITTAKELRSERLHTEIERYLKTPYISPLHLLYMVKPPRWIKGDHEYPFRDSLYKEATTAFNQIIYMNFIIEHVEPIKRISNIYTIIPKNTYNKMVKSLFLVLLSVFLYVVYPFFIKTSVNYTILAAPIVLRHCLILIYIGKAIFKHGRFSPIARELKNVFGEVNPNVKWIDLYANTEKGHHILDVWKKEITLRQYRDTEHRTSQKSAQLEYPTNYVQNMMVHFEIDDISVCPYPSTAIPEWYDEYLIYVNSRLSEENDKKITEISNYKGKVIDINTVRRLRK